MRNNNFAKAKQKTSRFVTVLEGREPSATPRNVYRRPARSDFTILFMVCRHAVDERSLVSRHDEVAINMAIRHGRDKGADSDRNQKKKTIGGGSSDRPPRGEKFDSNSYQVRADAGAA